MNLEFTLTLPPIKVLMVNPLAPAAQLTVVKILSGTVFGNNQPIDLIILVYSNEKPTAEAYKVELISCAFSCMNSVEVSSDLPSVSDADVFCFMTNFANPNCIDFDNIDTDEQFDTLYLIIKIAYNFSKPLSAAEKPLDDVTTKGKKSEHKARKPIFIADGLVAIDILMSLAQNMPHDAFFCPTPLISLAKCTLGDYLKVHSNEINDVLVWAANDQVFYIEIEKPLILQDTTGDGSQCDWDMIGKDMLQPSNLDHTQFNASWLKKEFIKKIALSASKNPYGCIYKAAKISKSLQTVWATRSSDDEMKSYSSMGVISDGSLGTIKGYPYVLPLVFSGDSWSVDKRFEKDTHLKQEIKRINKAVKEHHHKLIPYCKKFLEDNVINQAFIPDDESSVLSLIGHSFKLSI